MYPRQPTTRLMVFFTLILASAVCSSVPTGTSVLVLPRTGKSHDLFRAEDARRRQRAATEMQPTDHGTVTAQGRYDMVYMQCMYAEGNQIPVPGRGWRSPVSGAPATPPSNVPPPPAGAPPPPPVED